MRIPSFVKNIFGLGVKKMKEVRAYKVTVKAIRQGQHFCIVKKGVFDISLQGLTKALNAGAVDRYGAEAPKIIVIEMRPKASRRPGIVEFLVQLQQSTSSTTEVIDTVAQFKEFPQTL